MLIRIAVNGWMTLVFVSRQVLWFVMRRRSQKRKAEELNYSPAVSGRSQNDVEMPPSRFRSETGDTMATPTAAAVSRGPFDDPFSHDKGAPRGLGDPFSHGSATGLLGAGPSTRDPFASVSGPGVSGSIVAFDKGVRAGPNSDDPLDDDFLAESVSASDHTPGDASPAVQAADGPSDPFADEPSIERDPFEDDDRPAQVTKLADPFDDEPSVS